VGSRTTKNGGIEMKYRVWNVRRWLKNTEVAIMPDGKILILDRDEKIWSENIHYELKVSLNTGVKDKTGKEIFEGDIVTEHHGGLAFEADFFQTEQVKWDAFGYLPFQRVIGGKMHDFAKNLKEYIVIGNIYENPELLKVTPHSTE
jgi:uncharacterized phage protein (TIGR01671 family)